MDYAGNFTDYTTSVLGLDCIDHGDMRKAIVRFPNMVSNFFTGRLVSIDGHEYVLVRNHSTEVDFPMSLLIRRIKSTEEKLGRPCILSLDALDGDQRRQLIRHRICFVVPGRQIYIPTLGTYLTERRLNAMKEVAALTPAAQLLLLYHLQKQDIGGLGFKEVARMTDYPPKTISVAVAELHQAGLCDIERMEEGRGKCVRFKAKGHGLWNMAFPMLVSPVDKVGYVCGKLETDGLPLSYDDALSHYTDMGATPGHTFAVEKRSEAGRTLSGRVSIANLPDSTRIEFWRYNPSTLAKDGFIDPLSMSLIYRDYDDERVQGQIQRLLDRIL